MAAPGAAPGALPIPIVGELDVEGVAEGSCWHEIGSGLFFRERIFPLIRLRDVLRFALGKGNTLPQSQRQSIRRSFPELFMAFRSSGPRVPRGSVPERLPPTKSAGRLPAGPISGRDGAASERRFPRHRWKTRNPLTPVSLSAPAFPHLWKSCGKPDAAVVSSSGPALRRPAPGWHFHGNAII